MKFRQSLAHRLLNFNVGLVAIGLAAGLHAQTPGKAVVRAVSGDATFATAGSAAAPLKVGATLYSGTTIKTSGGAVVDLFLGNSAGVVRVAENSTLSIDKLVSTETGADSVVEVQLNLPDGTIWGNANKLSAASKYEIKVPNGVAGIRGTQFRMNSAGYVVLLNGSLIMVYVPPNGNPTPYPLFGPPAQYFSPTEGVKPAPDELVKEVSDQFGAMGRGPGDHGHPPPWVPGPPPFIPPSEVGRGR
jgi:hypothetical protein